MMPVLQPVFSVLAFIIVPFVLCLFVDKLFWRSGLFARLRASKDALDAVQWTGGSPAPLAVVRHTDKFGDKLVVRHHLLSLGEELVYRLKTVFIIFAGISLIAAIWTAIVTARTASAAGVVVKTEGGTETATIIGANAAWFGQFVQALANQYALPINGIAWLICAVAMIHFFHAQVFKYRDVL